MGDSDMNMVQESFLHWLHYQRNHERLSNYVVYDSYYNGDHEVDIPPKVKAALESELGTVDNYCRIVVDSAVDYICGGEIGIEVRQPKTSVPQRGQDAVSKAEALLYDVYAANQLLYEEILKIATIMGKKGDVFLKLYIEDKQIKIRVLRPDTCFPGYRLDDYKEMQYCAIKWFDEGGSADYSSSMLSGIPGNRQDTSLLKRELYSPNDSKRKLWKAQVFRPDVVEYYELGETAETEYSQWKLIGIEKNMLGFIPVIHIKNSVDDLEFGVSDLQVMTDLQDALNKTVTDMLLTMDNQAFQRLFVFGGQSPKGHEISMEPGMITEVPNENGRLEVVPAADIDHFIQAMREIVDHICIVTSMPRSVFSKSEGGPMSGYALRIHYVPFERKCMKKEIILKNRLAELNRMIFAAAKLLGMGDYTGFRTKMQFTSGLPIDEEVQTQVHEMELRNKIKSRRTIMQERGIEDVDAEMAQIEAEAASEVKAVEVKIG